MKSQVFENEDYNNPDNTFRLNMVWDFYVLPIYFLEFYGLSLETLDYYFDPQTQ